MAKKDNSCRKNNSPLWLQGQLISEIITPPIYIQNEGRLSGISTSLYGYKG